MSVKNEQLADEVLREFTESIESPKELHRFYFTINRLRFRGVPLPIWMKLWNWKNAFKIELDKMGMEKSEAAKPGIYDLSGRLQVIMAELKSKH